MYLPTTLGREMFYHITDYIAFLCFSSRHKLIMHFGAMLHEVSVEYRMYIKFMKNTLVLWYLSSLLQLSLCSTSTALATNIYIYYHILQITSEGQLVLDISHSSPRDIQLPGRVKLGGFLSQQFSQQWSIILQMRIDLANHSEVPMYGWDTNSSTKLHFEHNQQHFWIRCRPKS